MRRFTPSVLPLLGTLLGAMGMASAEEANLKAYRQRAIQAFARGDHDEAKC